jgi:hypothetical protein
MSPARLRAAVLLVALAAAPHPAGAQSDAPVRADSTRVAPERFSHAALDSVLVRILRDGRVDYGGLSRDHGTLDRYLSALAAADPDGWPRGEQIAFWVNAYNARVLDRVIRRPGLKSVLDVGKKLGVPTLGFFHEKRPTAGHDRSLDDIEHRILRARFHEPRIHFVLNCAAVSCPVLPARALTGAELETDLEAATHRFLADSTRNRIEPGRGLWLSTIFKWYGDDFRATDGSVQAFIERHWPGSGPFAPDLPVRFLDYDWSLNGSW